MLEDHNSLRFIFQDLDGKVSAAFQILAMAETGFFNGIVYQQREYPNIFFCKDGENYRIDNRHLFVMGGAYSTDKYLRLREG